MNCQGCGYQFEVHPHYLLAYDTAKKRQWAFCRACHEVKEQTLGKDYEGQDCAIARALETLGERWTLLIVRDAFYGVRRFNDFQ